MHITLRAITRSLRHQHVARAVLRALRDSQRESFRIAHYSIQNHLHLLVETENKADLLWGMRSLVVRIARRINRLLFRRGTVWADRLHGRALKTPREVRPALVYVVHNRAKHARQSSGPSLDPLSSAEWFSGFSQPLPAAFRSVTPRANAPPSTWLLCVGWRRHGLVSIHEVPKV